jgi:hypothetical protein
LYQIIGAFYNGDTGTMRCGTLNRGGLSWIVLVLNLLYLLSRPDKFHWRSFLAALLKSPLPPEAQLEIVASSSKEGVENTVSCLPATPSQGPLP